MKLTILAVMAISTGIINNEVNYTVYNALPGQTDNSPTITADGSKIIDNKVISGEQRWIAVSRDLLKTYNFGDSIEFCNCSDKKFNGKWIIHDVMNKRFTNKIDFLVPKSIKLGKGKCFIK